MATPLLMYSSPSCAPLAGLQGLQAHREQQDDPALAALLTADAQQAAAAGGRGGLHIVEVEVGRAAGAAAQPALWLHCARLTFSSVPCSAALVRLEGLTLSLPLPRRTMTRTWLTTPPSA